MLFKEFGKKENPPVLLVCGMMQDWRKLHEVLKPLEESYRLIITAYDGFYDGSRNFTSFADQAIQIEEYIGKKYFGKIHGAFGASQGGLMLTELLTRNKIKIKTVVMDGCYVAHQGKVAGKVTAKMFKKYKKTGKFPVLIRLTLALMGLKKDDLKMMNNLYLNASDLSIDRNFIANYTYKVRPELKNTESFVYLICGSKEPYAKKSHNILKKYLRHYDEEIMDGCGHGDFLLKHSKECCNKIKSLIR